MARSEIGVAASIRARSASDVYRKGEPGFLSEHDPVLALGALIDSRSAIGARSASYVCCRGRRGFTFERHPALALGALMILLSACEQRRDLPPGVLAIFGGVGLGPGDFSYPRAIAASPLGPVYVVDKSGRVQRFSSDGTFETSWRMARTEEGKPVGLKVHPDGRVFVADTHNHQVVVFNKDGGQLASFGREGTGDGEFLLPTDVAFDAKGNIYVSEYGGNDRITQWSADFRFIRAFADSPIEGLRLSRPTGLAIDEEETLWVADACHHRVIGLSLDGQPRCVFGEFGTGPGQMRYPYDLGISPEGTIMVCEYEGNRLQWFTKDGRSLRTWGRSGRSPGELFAPWGAAYGVGGRVYVVDSLNSRVQIIEP